MKLLHMVTADPQRNPSFTMFGNPDYFFQTTGSPAVAESPAFAWNHGGIQPEITTVWVGFVGPGVSNRGTDSATFADETDYRPTMLALLGLQDEYQHEGRVLAEEIEPSALPSAVRESGAAFVQLAAALKQINAPLGQLGKDSLMVSTVALNGSDPTMHLQSARGPACRHYRRSQRARWPDACSPGERRIQRPADSPARCRAADRGSRSFVGLRAPACGSQHARDEIAVWYGRVVRAHNSPPGPSCIFGGFL